VQFLNIVALLTALLLSTIAAGFSVVGMTAIFSASFWPIVIMVSALELAKVVTACWLKYFWYEIPHAIKIYLSACTIILMAITSIGIYGFLAKAHLDQQVRVETGVGEKIKLVDVKIANENRNLSDLEFQLKVLDTPLSRMTELSRSNVQARRVLRELSNQKRVRGKIQKQRQEHLEKLADLNTRRIQLNSKMAKLEAEVGPIKYVANLVYGKASKDQLERAVRWLIIILVATFDPLAIALLLGSNVHFKQATRIRSIKDILKDVTPMNFTNETKPIIKPRRRRRKTPKRRIRKSPTK